MALENWFQGLAWSKSPRVKYETDLEASRGLRGSRPRVDQHSAPDSEAISPQPIRPIFPETPAAVAGIFRLVEGDEPELTCRGCAGGTPRTGRARRSQAGQLPDGEEGPEAHRFWNRQAHRVR